MNLNQLSRTYKLKKKQNVLIGCIYRHPSMNQEELKKYYLNNLLEKSAMEINVKVLVTLTLIY